MPTTIQGQPAVRRRSVIAALVCAAALVSASTAQATGYVNDKAAWQALTPEARIGYVQGLNDALNYTFLDDTLVNALAKRGRTACLAANKTTAAQLSEYITIAYRSQQNAPLAPTAIYIIKMGDICSDYVNRARQDFGLGPQ